MFSGTQLQANIKTANRKNALVIPTAYIVNDNTVLLKNGEERKITIGSQNEGWTEIISGISETDEIVKPK